MKKYTVKQIENFEFNAAQKRAYNKLVKACNECRKSGLWLDARQSSLNGYPFELADAITTEFGKKQKYDLEMPMLYGAKIVDAGADDTFYFDDAYIQD